jgi:HTH-type transcriptional regulator/antitoxin HigA
MIPKLIKKESEYEAALARIDQIMSSKPGTPEGDELDLLVHLVEIYEDRHYPIPKPDPLAAIRFRMEQQGLRPSDLIPYLGGKSKVSEVLSGKRPLSLTMIRRLHDGLGIPAEVLLDGQRKPVETETPDVDWSDFPFAEVFKRGWFAGSVSSWRDLKKRADEILDPFLYPPGMPALETVQLRRTGPARSTKEQKALWAWEARVWQLAQRQGLPPARPAVIDERLIGEIARLSPLENGPVVAREMLAKSGIRLVHEPHMPRTRVDGAAVRCHDGSAIVGMTLRYDRLDYFWFTLCHELAHLMLHLKNDGCKVIVEDLEAEDRSRTEIEADKTAMEAMVPKKQWLAFRKRKHIGKGEIQDFAATQRLHPAIIAGRLRRETGNYSLFSDMLGNGQVRRFFSSDRPTR